MADTLNERSQSIFEAIVEDYINTAEPVGSRAITKRHRFDLSPATVRNVMADLEEMGLLVSPHTSAGRIPTEKGYQYYVESLLKVRDLPDEFRSRFEGDAGFAGKSMEAIMQEAGNMLSSISKYTGLVMAPRFQSTVFRQIEFVRLSHARILVIFVSEAGLVQNKVIEPGVDFSQRDLESITRYLNQRLTGMTIAEVRERIATELREERSRFNRLEQQALELSGQALQEDIADQIYIAGTSYMLEQPEFTSNDSMVRIMRALESKQQLIDLLDCSQQASGVQIFIGSQATRANLDGCSLVAAPFSGKKGAIGTLGVIGPMRMNYSQVIPIVDFTATLVSRMLDRESQ
jgi:heat-inducible transcriptional repressor